MTITSLKKSQAAVVKLPGMSNASHASYKPQVDFMGLHSAVVGEKPTITSMQGHPQHFVPAVKASHFVQAQMYIPEYRKSYETCVSRACTWSKTRLQDVYKAEYNSLRSRKQQAKAKHIKFKDRLKDIRDWLIHLGPRPAEGWTVHRINNYKGYQPGNLKWATKLEQTQIRNVTKWHDVDGKKMTTKQFAKFLDLTYSCLYKRLQNGWTIQRLLDNRKKGNGIPAWPFPALLAHELEPKYAQRKNFKQPRLDWFLQYMPKLIAKHCLKQSPKEVAALCTFQEELDKAEETLTALLKQQAEQEDQEFQLLVAAVTPMQVPGFS